MLERETELIKQIIVECTINGREAIRLSDVIGASLPRGVKAFMTAEVVTLLEADFRQSGRLSRVTEGLGSTVIGERSLLRSLAMEYVLQRDEYLKLVEDAVHFLENYLCRPQWTLNQLMFEKEAKISFLTLARKFECVVDYSYFSMLVERHARRKDWKEVEAEQFRSLLAAIDEEIIKQHSPRELALLTKPMFDFLLFGDVSMTRPIPLGAILLFFEDKKLSPAKNYVERICQVRSRTQLSMNELIGILEDFYQVETAVKEEVAESEQQIFNPAERTTQTESVAIEESPVAAEPAATQPVVEEPSSTQLDIEELSSAQPVVEEQVEALPVQSVTDNPTPEQLPQIEEQAKIEVTQFDTAELEKDVPPLDPQPSLVVKVHELAAYARERQVQRYASFLAFPKRSTTGELRSKPSDIHEMLTAEQRDKFIRTIFKNDDRYCYIFLNSLNAATTWREAQPYLRDLFKMKNLDILSPDVVEFTDAMQSRFHPELKKTV